MGLGGWWVVGVASYGGRVLQPFGHKWKSSQFHAKHYHLPLHLLPRVNLTTAFAFDPMEPSLKVNGPLGDEEGSCYQNVVVMRHGDRIDNTEPLWITSAERPWDPPLAKEGFVRAFTTGRKLRDSLSFPIHRVIVSPFLRCVQTASRVVTALCAIADQDPAAIEGQAVRDIDPSKVKVAIEYGLCEMLNSVAIRKDAAPKDGNFVFRISELECLFPDGTVDSSYESVYKEMPLWEETPGAARSRYQQIIVALADKYPHENLLLVTHGEGVGVSVSTFMKDIEVVEVEYCAYSELRRQVLQQEAGSFSVVSNPCGTGIKIAALQWTRT